jgi:hypothetical protein
MSPLSKSIASNSALGFGFWFWQPNTATKRRVKNILLRFFIMLQVEK